MKKVLTPTILVLVLSGCEFAPTMYQEAAEEFSKDVCTGIVTGINHQSQSNTSYLTDKHKMYFKCIEEAGTSDQSIAYTSVPVKYFKEKK